MANPVFHPPIKVVANDNWTFTGTLTDLDGSALGLTDAAVELHRLPPRSVIVGEGRPDLAILAPSSCSHSG
jgi:hypothetical protein